MAATINGYPVALNADYLFLEGQVLHTQIGLDGTAYPFRITTAPGAEPKIEFSPEEGGFKLVVIGLSTGYSEHVAIGEGSAYGANFRYAVRARLLADFKPDGVYEVKVTAWRT